MASRNGVEHELYPRVATWLTRRFGCHDTRINPGSGHGRVDVVGLRDVGGELSGESQVVAVEVKRGSYPFLSAAGQAAGYGVCADLTYLAYERPTQFTADERAIAAALGVGLLFLPKRGGVQEIQTSPLHQPLDSLRLTVIKNMGYSVCSLCSTVFMGSANNTLFVERADGRRGALKRAAEANKGYVWWLHEASDRDSNGAGKVRHRRFLCPDCVEALYADVSLL